MPDLGSRRVSVRKMMQAWFAPRGATAPPALTVSSAVAEPAGAAAALDPFEASGDNRRAYWEEMFAAEDPWDYGSPYEQLKYERSLALLPDGLIGSALELACAEGRFTRQLAPRVRRLLATDISARAVARTQVRCADLSHVETGVLDFLSDPLPPNQDLIVCSEVLYYLNDRDRLAEVAGRLAQALAPGGLLLTAHAFLLADQSDRTGFDWDHAYGAQTIAETFAETPGLRHEKGLRTPVYRIDLFRRDDAADSSEPEMLDAPLGPPLDPEIERWLVWDGAVLRRKDAALRTTDRTPVLSYGAIGDAEAFAAQIGWLRSHGYHSISGPDLARRLRDGAPLRGRPVMITFDGARRDLFDLAWPLLQRRDFAAEVFLDADHVTGRGDASGLLTWLEIRELGRQGVSFGLRLAGDARGRTPAALLQAAVRARTALKARLGYEPVAASVAGAFEGEAVVRGLAAAGCSLVFARHGGLVRLGDDPLALSRIPVGPNDAPATFADKLQAAD